MRKKLSLLIALAISLSVSSTSFAAGANNATINTNNNVQATSDTVKLTIDDAIKNVESSNTELKLMKDKIDSLNKQYDLDHNLAISLSTDIPGINGFQVKTQQLIVPLKDEQNVKNQKDAIEVRTNSIKLDMERQYLNILTCNDQIDNINKTMVNIDEQINKLQQQISLGLATSNSLDPLNVQKSQLEAQINSIKSQIDQSLLVMKQYLNIDLNKKLELISSKKDFIKFDDTNITEKINQAVQKDYAVRQAKTSMDIVEKQKELYVEYDNNISGGLSTSEADLLGSQSGIVSATTNSYANLWSKYYTLKSSENAVKTAALSEKSAQADYDKAKSNYDSGMLDKVSLDTKALALDKQKNLTQRTVNEYMILQEEFKYMLDGHGSAQLSSQSMGVSGIGY